MSIMSDIPTSMSNQMSTDIIQHIRRDRSEFLGAAVCGVLAGFR